MAYATAVETLPSNNTAGVGKGLTVSLLKALTHASIIRATEEHEYLAMGDDVRKSELEAIAEHLSKSNLLHPLGATTAFLTLLDNLHTVGAAIKAEGATWDEKTTRDNLALLVDKITAVCQKIDSELGGISNAETGDQL